jgi:hypothetical protein
MDVFVVAPALRKSANDDTTATQRICDLRHFEMSLVILSPQLSAHTYCSY